jgi:hypothetical protein
LPPEELRQFNIVNAFAKPNEMWGVPIEIDPNTTGVMIAVDGTKCLWLKAIERLPGRGYSSATFLRTGGMRG